ncbi:unnamed protein product, partial [marine sediment metagenome]
HAGKTSLQIKQETEGSPENLVLKKEQLRSEMMPLKKHLIRLKMDAVHKAFKEAEASVLKSVDRIGSMEEVERQLKALGFPAPRSTTTGSTETPLI